MTIDDAIKILDPETRRVTLRAIPVLERIDKDQEACRLAVAALRRQEERQWIPVTERMPQEHQIVVGWTKYNPFSRYREEVVTWNGKGWVFVYAQRYVTNVKYWMPLPEPPEEVQK